MNKQSLCEAFNEAARHYASSPAIAPVTGPAVSFAAFAAQSDALAYSLIARGVSPGDRVALYCPNGTEFPVAYAGILKSGAVVVPCNLLLNVEEILGNLADADAVALIFHPQYGNNARSLQAGLPALRILISTGAAIGDAASWESVLNEPANAASLPVRSRSDPAAILYTSGTTGRPKGAVLSHGNLLANSTSVRQAMQWQSGSDVVLVVLPMFHAFAATVGMLTPLLHGCTLVPVARFEPEQIAQAIKASRATIFLGVPSMYSLFLRLREDSVGLFESLRFCVSGGAALPVDVLTRFEARFGVPIYEGDGPTECSPVTCVNPIGGIAKPGTVGLPVPGVEMRIQDAVGRELPDGNVGEIAVRGENVFQGYWNQAEATADSFCGDWFLTGDLGTRDSDGYFSIVDRKKDLIIVNGMNVYPRMIEEALYRLPEIKEAAVVGQPHALHGEVPEAYVALHRPDALTAAEIRAFCRTCLGQHQIPRVIHLLDALPRNAAGKILKRELRRSGELERGVDLGGKPA